MKGEIMNKPADVIYQELGPNQSCMAIMNETGDTKTIWDRTKTEEVESVRAQFDALKAKGYMAYKVTGNDGTKGEVMHTFDPEAERVIFAPALRGG